VVWPEGRPNVLGVRIVATSGKANKVDEEHGHDLAFLARPLISLSGAE
jgi:hypothetical protein